MKVDRTLRALEAMAERSVPMGVLELSSALDEPAPSLHRTLRMLVDRHFVVQDADTKRYRLGPAILSLADAYREQSRLVAIAQPALDALRSELHESVFLCELIDQSAVVVAVAESPRPLRAFMRLGHRMPFHAAASAKVILAFQEEDVVARLLERNPAERYTSRTMGSLRELAEDLDRTRHRGYSVCDQELEVGIKAVARPIRDSTGKVVASVAVVAPRERLAGSHRAKALNALAQAAGAISLLLGYRVPGGAERNGRSPRAALSPAGGRG
jgi:DNA-binding IclR family transcriptional regulator